ncbi:hypothetical protein B0T14DRAFT_481779 [Immersiella caudata]|uniref:Peptide hydrolase n=1 Tax=Immersiella caudata TaxID=314043 RepID=A0AA40C154_9PEZI|nr:hypothetical protein B0T14DRAFT_481779 [Immersiella caudata]
MRSFALFSLGISSACLVKAAPSAPGAGLSLIKSSPTDPGTWVTEEQKITEYHAKDIHFVDITKITDPEVLAYYSLPDEEGIPALVPRAVTYPSNISHRAEAEPLIAQLSTANLQSWAKTLTDFQTRHYRTDTGLEAANWLLILAKSLAAPNPAITVSSFPHSFEQPSIIVRIPGSVSSSLVIFGAHFDSINDRTSDLNARAPGAVDNASGTVVLLETLRVIASSGFAPQSTLEFQFYAGEEGGMLGSQDIFAKYKAESKNVLAMVNTDMAGYSPSGKISIWTDYVDEPLTRYVRTVAEGYTGETTEDTCGTRRCSDHNSAMSNGFPAAYVCDEKRRTAFKVHNENDSYDKLQWDTVLRHTKFLTAFAVEASYLSG